MKTKVGFLPQVRWHVSWDRDWSDTLRAPVAQLCNFLNTLDNWSQSILIYFTGSSGVHSFPLFLTYTFLSSIFLGEQVRALTEARDTLAQELSTLRGSKQTLEAALTAEKERALQLENEKVGN